MKPKSNSLCLALSLCALFISVDSKCVDGAYLEPNGLCVGLSQDNCTPNGCVDGAKCVHGKCLCDSAHFHSVQKTCLTKKSVHQNCTRDVECLQTATLNMRCISGQCRCPGKFEYANVQRYEYGAYNRLRTDGGGYKPFGRFTEPFVEMCAPIVGEHCQDGYCMENAFCDAEVQKSHATPVALTTCKCINETLTPSNDFRSCARTYGQDCTVESDCIAGLVCSAGKCYCPSSWHQYFDSSTRACVTKVAGHCTSTSTCVPNAECVFVSSTNSSGHCRCQANFIANEQRDCDHSYGSYCSETSSKCDTVAGLICVNNKCSCSDTMYKYDSRVRKCVSLAGGRCDYEGNFNCVANAFCQREQNLAVYECKCGWDCEESDDHECILKTNANGAEGSFKCPPSEFRCTYDGGCIPMEERCDGKSDCLDNTDEANCKEVIDERIYYNNTCDLHKCDNGQCISNEWVCDGIVHCDDNSDEKNCRENTKNITGDSGNIELVISDMCV